MNIWDAGVIFLYVVGFLSLGRLIKGGTSGKDYFLAGKSFGWFPLAISTAATQLSAISFISAPAFVGLKAGGGIMWLTYEFAVPLAMIFLMIYLIPPMYRSGVVSVYGYLQDRFGTSTRVLLSIVFQFSRAFGASVMIYAIALILSNVMGLPMSLMILLMGGITLLYAVQGGMKAVVYGDMIQMGILFLGILICLYYGLDMLGGWGEFTAKVAPDRLVAVDFDNWGVREGEEFGFWPMVLGGFFLYASYYGTNQSQVQRLFSASNMKTVKHTLLANGLMRFPITLIYCLMGLVLGTLFMHTPELLAQVPPEKPDLMIPVFIKTQLPHGIIGLLIVAIFSAAMSSLSSVINSLSAASVEDFFNRDKQLSDQTYIRYSKLSSIFWGCMCILLAFFTGNIADTVIEAINKIGSVFYGPILATFVAAVGIRRIGGRGVNVGLIAGVGVNIILWLFYPHVFWFWWNLIGFVVALGTSFLLSFIGKQTSNSSTQPIIQIDQPDLIKILVLMIFFLLILGFSIGFPLLF